MTQLQLARLLNVSDKTISNWERDYSEPDLDMLKSIALCFNVDIQYFFNDRNEDTPINSHTLSSNIPDNINSIIDSIFDKSDNSVLDSDISGLFDDKVSGEATDDAANSDSLSEGNISGNISVYKDIYNNFTIKLFLTLIVAILSKTVFLVPVLNYIFFFLCLLYATVLLKKDTKYSKYKINCIKILTFLIFAVIFYNIFAGTQIPLIGHARTRINSTFVTVMLTCISSLFLSACSVQLIVGFTIAEKGGDLNINNYKDLVIFTAILIIFLLLLNDIPAILIGIIGFYTKIIGLFSLVVALLLFIALRYTYIHSEKAVKSAIIIISLLWFAANTLIPYFFYYYNFLTAAHIPVNIFKYAVFFISATLSVILFYKSGHKGSIYVKFILIWLIFIFAEHIINALLAAVLPKNDNFTRLYFSISLIIKEVFSIIQLILLYIFNLKSRQPRREG